MGLFGFKKKNKKVEFQIYENEKLWIEESFNWLVSAFGLPNKNTELITFTDKYFPHTHANSELKIENIIKDLSDILKLDSAEISFEIQKDIRDFQGTPYEIEGLSFESDTEKNGNKYKIFVANSLPPNRLLSRLIVELVVIKMYESELHFDTDNGMELIYFAAFYLGFGLILSQNLFDTGTSYDISSHWETKWNYHSEIPQEILVYAFALYLKISENEISSLKEKLPSDFINLLYDALEYAELYPSNLLSKKELDANNLYFQAQNFIKNYEYESATLKLNEIISMHDEKNPISFISYVFERLGYIKIREMKFNESISYFQKALEIDSNNYIAEDNIAYALIKMGDIKEGKKYIDKSIQLAVKDMASIYRNLALYFWAKGYFDEAEDNFTLSLESVSVPVFLLELDYSKFLLAKGEKEKSNKYLQLSIAKGEPEATKTK